MTSASASKHGQTHSPESQSEGQLQALLSEELAANNPVLLLPRQNSTIEQHRWMIQAAQERAE